MITTTVTATEQRQLRGGSTLAGIRLAFWADNSKPGDG